MKMVYVVMAVFNGEKFLDEQIKSIFDQKQIDVKLLIVDDGSTDNSLNIILKWQQAGFEIYLESADHVGSSKAYASILKRVPRGAFVAFSDQDDVWKDDKLAVQIESFNSDKPSLVTSRRFYIDEEGREIGTSPTLRRPPSWRNAFIENIAYGNTIVLNPKGLELITLKAIPTDVYFDAWIYLLLSSVGTVITLDEPLVRYRLHENNQIGIGKNRMNVRKVRLGFLKFYTQVQMLVELYPEYLPNEVSNEAHKFLAAYRSSSITFRYLRVFKLKVYRQSAYDHFLFRLFTPLVIRIKNSN